MSASPHISFSCPIPLLPQSFLFDRSISDRQQSFLQKLIARLFLFPGEMLRPVLFRTMGIVQPGLSELLACEVEHAAIHLIEAMIIAVLQGYAVHLSPVNVLDQEGCNRALAQGSVCLRPILPHPRRAGFGAPAFGQQVIVIARRQAEFIPDAGCFPAVKAILLHFLFHEVSLFIGGAFLLKPQIRLRLHGFRRHLHDLDGRAVRIMGPEHPALGFAPLNFSVDGTTRLPDRIIGFVNVLCHQAQMADTDHIRPRNPFPRTVGKQLQILAGRDKQINGGKRSVLPVHTESLPKAQYLHVEARGVQNAPRADGHVAQPGDDLELIPAFIRFAHAQLPLCTAPVRGRSDCLPDACFFLRPILIVYFYITKSG